MTSLVSNEDSRAVIAWWCALSLVAVLNIALWTRVGVTSWPYLRGRSLSPADKSRRLQVFVQFVLSGLFTFGCAFRSFLPRSEGRRICLLDSWISNAVLGRAVATVAELALVAQFALVVHACAVQARSRAGRLVSMVLVPLIVVAEICSWYTTLTTNFAGSVVEESLWAVMAMLMTTALVKMWPYLRGPRRSFVGTAIFLGLGYIVFMWTTDVPMYQARTAADRAAGRVYVSVRDGWRDGWRRRVVTRRWEDWKSELPWMSLYFSVGVWVSMALIELPRLEASRVLKPTARE